MLTVSIVTPSYNQGEFIEQCLLSVKRQTHPAVEHLVIDGGSTDETLEILKRYSSQPGWEHLKWISEPDRGQSDALNKGFRAANSDIVGWLNSDDRYRPGCFEYTAEAFRANPQADIIYGDYTWIDQDGRLLQVRREIEFSRFILFYHRVLYIHTTSTFFRRRIFAEGNFIAPEFHYAMDYEFFLRLANKKYNFLHIPELLADFRWHEASKSASSPGKELEERDRIIGAYAPGLQRLPGRHLKKLALLGLRRCAGGLRYMEKLFRGYYWTQWAAEKGFSDQARRTP